MSNLTTHRNALLTVDSKRNIALYIDRIIMLKGEGNYTLFHLQDGKLGCMPTAFTRTRIFFKRKVSCGYINRLWLIQNLF